MFLDILHKNAVFLVLCATPQGHFLRVAKELGACTLGARFAGGKATTNKKQKIDKTISISCIIYIKKEHIWIII